MCSYVHAGRALCLAACGRKVVQMSGDVGKPVLPFRVFLLAVTCCDEEFPPFGILRRFWLFKDCERKRLHHIRVAV